MIKEHKQVDLERKALLKQKLNKQVDDRTLFVKGTDVSYYHEGASEFRTGEL